MNLVQDLRADPNKPIVNPIPIKPEGSKVERMVAQSAKIEAGHVYLPKDAPWLATFMRELLAFPNGAMTIRSTASRNFSSGCSKLFGSRFQSSRPTSSADLD